MCSECIVACSPEEGSPSHRPPDYGWGNQGNVRVYTSKGRNTINGSIALGLVMLAGTAIEVTVVNGLHAQDKAQETYADFDPSAINNPDAHKTLPPKTGDFDGHSA